MSNRSEAVRKAPQLCRTCRVESFWRSLRQLCTLWGKASGLLENVPSLTVSTHWLGEHGLLCGWLLSPAPALPIVLAPALAKCKAVARMSNLPSLAGRSVNWHSTGGACIHNFCFLIRWSGNHHNTRCETAEKHVAWNVVDFEMSWTRTQL